jgi:hypothetical protein
MPVITNSIVTPSLTAYSDVQTIQLGATVVGTDGSLFEYVQALSAISGYNAVGIDESGKASNLTTTLAATVKRVGVAQISIAVSCFGWVQRMGKMSVNVLADCNDFVALFTTATPGKLDDATISEALVLGLNTFASTSTASTVSALGAAPLQIFPFANPA